MRRAENAGYSAMVLTVDTQRAGRREADLKNKFVFKLSPSLQTPPCKITLPKWTFDVFDGSKLLVTLIC